jgi:hypothetical protein
MNRGQDVTNRRLSRSWLLTVSASLFKRINQSRPTAPLPKRWSNTGFPGVTVYNDMLYQPAWLPLLEIARHTKRVRLGPAAVNPFTSHPINTYARGRLRPG